MMMKKYASLLFALVLALSLSVSAAADADVYMFTTTPTFSPRTNAPRSTRRRPPSPTSTAAACTS